MTRKDSDRRIDIRVENTLLNAASFDKSTPANKLVGLMVMAIGSLPLLVGLGVIKASHLNAPPMVLCAIGLAFTLAGLSVFIQAMGLSPKNPLAKSLGFLIMVSFFAPFAWVVFCSSAPQPVRLMFALPVVLIPLVSIVRFLKGMAGPKRNAISQGQAGAFKDTEL